MNVRAEASALSHGKEGGVTSTQAAAEHANACIGGATRSKAGNDHNLMPPAKI
jgi:hypothetical protein